MLKKILLFIFLIFPISINLYADTSATIITTGPKITADLSDAGLTAAVNKVIANDPDTQNLMVAVQVRNRVASLSAVLKSPEEAAYFIAVVETVPGIMNVDASQLTLTQGQVLPFDLILTAKVKGSLIREQAFGPEITLKNLPISVQTNYGIVYLKGFVDSESQLIYVVKVAQLVPGVPRVISMLTVKSRTVYN